MRKNKNQRRYAPTGGGGIKRISMALSIGMPWRIPSDSGGGISGICSIIINPHLPTNSAACVEIIILL